MLGKLAKLGYGSDKIVPIAFHVDYFNKPWKDRFSDPSHSSREMSYNTALKRNDLYFTPMLMIDGRYPMLGSDQPKAVAALRRTSAEPAGASIAATLKGNPSERKRTLDVRVGANGPGSPAIGREVMAGVVVYEDPVTTKVESGENEGKTLVERYAVRKFLWKTFTLPRSRAEALNFDLELGADWDASKCGVAVWVQDWNNARVYQADAQPWTPAAKVLPTSARN